MELDQNCVEPICPLAFECSFGIRGNSGISDLDLELRIECKGNSGFEGFLSGV
jgi:hypothetical protein